MCDWYAYESDGIVCRVAEFCCVWFNIRHALSHGNSGNEPNFNGDLRRG